jgi:hypothetical protein
VRPYVTMLLATHHVTPVDMILPADAVAIGSDAAVGSKLKRSVPISPTVEMNT